MALLIPDKRFLVLYKENFTLSSKKCSRLSSGTSGDICSRSSPIVSVANPGPLGAKQGCYPPSNIVISLHNRIPIHTASGAKRGPEKTSAKTFKDGSKKSPILRTSFGFNRNSGTR